MSSEYIEAHLDAEPNVTLQVEQRAQFLVEGEAQTIWYAEMVWRNDDGTTDRLYSVGPTAGHAMRMLNKDLATLGRRGPR